MINDYKNFRFVNYKNNKGEWCSKRKNLPELYRTNYDKFHRVKEGEHLFNIADKYYGDEWLHWFIQEANGLSMLGDFYPGILLWIPAPDTLEDVLLDWGR